MEDSIDLLQKFRQFDDELRKLYDRYELKDLFNHKVNNDGASSSLLTIMRSKKRVKGEDISDFKLISDLINISKDVKYFNAWLYFLRPFVTKSQFDGRYIQSFEDRRYLTYASCAYNSIYNYWDRVGDVLHLYFHTGLSIDQVYLKRVLNNFPKQLKSSAEYLKFKNHYVEKIEPILEIRQSISHHFLLETEAFYSVMDAKRNLEKINEIQYQKESYPEAIKDHTYQMLLGFDLLIDLLELAENRE